MNRFLTIFLFIILSNLNQAYSQCLSGNYTIGGSSPSYTTIASAISALTTNGVCGPVLFNIRSGTYNQQINIPPIIGSSSINTITFQAENGINTSVLLTNTAGTAVYINQSDNIVLKDLSIGSTTTPFYAIQLGNSSNNIEINNCRIASQN
ncbi:MAG: hypothetical protein L6Q66_10490, partial [Bacteroidia bacterium]|nr:hypothetical protein [Bacteroidia bacterium]